MAIIDNLISYWKLDEASGNALDAHGSNTLTDNSTVGATTGKINGARQFASASGESFSIASNSSLQTGDIDYTVAAWAYLDTKTVNRAIIAKYGADVNLQEYALFYSVTADRFQFDVIDPLNVDHVINADNFGSPSTGVWMYVAAWHDAINNTMNIQVNNGTVNSASYSDGSAVQACSFSIGALGQTTVIYFWDGRIDEVGFWKRVLTSGERTSLYNSGAGLAYPFTGVAVRPRRMLSGMGA